MWVNLQNAEPNSRVLLSLEWLDISSDKQVINNKKGRDGLVKCLLYVYVDSCKGLAQGSRTPSPIVTLNVGVEKEQETLPQRYSTNPVFEESFVFFVTNKAAVRFGGCWEAPKVNSCWSFENVGQSAKQAGSSGILRRL